MSPAASEEPVLDRGQDGLTGLFTVAEGQGLDVLDGLLGLARGDAHRSAIPLDPVRPELLAAGARRIATTAARWLTAEGGWRERQVLRDGRRTAGRVWDAHLGQGFTPRFTQASVRFWLDAARHLPARVGRPLYGTQPGDDGERTQRRMLRDMIAGEGAGSGDWVFFAVAHRALATFRLNGPDHAAITRKLRLASPLAMALEVAEDSTDAEVRRRLAVLLGTPAARIVECAEDRFSAAWGQYATVAFAAREDPVRVLARWSALGRVAGGWLDAAHAARRMDLARPVARFVRGLTERPFEGGGDAVRGAIAATPGVRNIQQRDELLAAVAAVVDLGPRLYRLRDELGGQRYGDERYAEAQVFLRDVDDIVGPCRRRLDGLARGLSGTLG